MGVEKMGVIRCGWIAVTGPSGGDTAKIQDTAITAWDRSDRDRIRQDRTAQGSTGQETKDFAG